MNVLDKKIALNQKGSGIFSFLLPMLASTIIPALIPKKKGSGIPKNFFLQKKRINMLNYLKNQIIHIVIFS